MIFGASKAAVDELSEYGRNRRYSSFTVLEPFRAFAEIGPSGSESDLLNLAVIAAFLLLSVYYMLLFPILVFLLWLPVRYLLETKGILGTRTGFPLGRLIPSAAHRGPHRRAPRSPPHVRPPTPDRGRPVISTGTTIDVPSRVYKSWGFHDG